MVVAIFQHELHDAPHLILLRGGHELPHPPGLSDISYFVVKDELADEDRQVRWAVLSPAKETVTDIDKFLARVHRETSMQGEARQELPGHLHRAVAGSKHHRLP